MKQRLKKAAAILLSAAMCAGTVAQAAPGAIAPGPKAEGAASVKDTEKETEKETKKESPEAGKKEVAHGVYAPGDYACGRGSERHSRRVCGGPHV